MNVNSALWREPAKMAFTKIKAIFLQNGKFICGLPIKCRYYQRMGLCWAPSTLVLCRVKSHRQSSFRKAASHRSSRHRRFCCQGCPRGCGQSLAPLVNTHSQTSHNGPPIEAARRHFRTSEPGKVEETPANCSCWLGLSCPWNERPSWLNPFKNAMPNGFFQDLKVNNKSKCYVKLRKW